MRNPPVTPRSRRNAANLPPHESFSTRFQVGLRKESARRDFESFARRAHFAASMSTHHGASNSKSPGESTAGRYGAFVVRIVIEPPAWLRDACQAIVRIAASLTRPAASAMPTLPAGVEVTPAFARRTKRGQELALARRAAVLAFSTASIPGQLRKDAVRAAQTEFYRLTGETVSQSALYVWEAKARKAGGVERAPIDTFLDGKVVPHKRTRQP